MFKVLILSSKRVLYEAAAESVFVCGDLGEFELLENHKPIISLLKQGDVIIDWEKSIPVKKGVMRMNKDELVALVEE